MVDILPKNVTRLIALLQKLPGIGPKMAARLTIFMLSKPEADLTELGAAVGELRAGIARCERCFHLTTESTQPCLICQDTSRDPALLCVVEEALDCYAIEKLRSFRGRYHILGGVISPIDGIGPGELTIISLLERVKEDGEIREVILATNPSLEGEATANYLKHELAHIIEAPRKLTISRIARGLPTGGALEYADELTLSRALEGRQKY